MTYNMTPFQSGTNILSMFSAVDTISGGFVFPLMIWSTFIILLIVLLRRNGTLESFTASSAVCSVLSIALLAAEVLPMLWVMVFSLMFAAAGIGLYIDRNRGG